MQGRIIREQQLTKVPIIGYIKCGFKNAQGYPQSTDYFIAEGNYKAKFDKEFGDKPKSIGITFLSDNLEDVCNERLEIRTSKENDGTGGRLFAWGNGQIFQVWHKTEQIYKPISIIDRPKLMEECEQKSGGQWKAILTLRFLILKIRGVWGVWQLNTKGDDSSIPQIKFVFDLVLAKAGTVINIPFDLSVKKVISQKPGSKNSFPVIQLIPNLSDESLEQVRQYIQSGQEIHGLITDDKIIELEQKEIAYELPEIPEDITKDKND